jgi:hypothetical protein
MQSNVAFMATLLLIHASQLAEAKEAFTIYKSRGNVMD